MDNGSNWGNDGQFLNGPEIPDPHGEYNHHHQQQQQQQAGEQGLGQGLEGYGASSSSSSSMSHVESGRAAVESTVDIATVDAALVGFWEEMKQEVMALVPEQTDFKTHSDLPLARIKRIMKADEDVRMVSAEAPVMFARACSMFIMEMTRRGWLEAEACKRRTLQKEDIHAAIAKTDVYDFLMDVVDGTIEEEQRMMKLEQKRKASVSSDT